MTAHALLLLSRHFPFFALSSFCCVFAAAHTLLLLPCLSVAHTFRAYLPFLILILVDEREDSCVDMFIARSTGFILIVMINIFVQI